VHKAIICVAITY